MRELIEEKKEQMGVHNPTLDLGGDGKTTCGKRKRANKRKSKELSAELEKNQSQKVNMRKNIKLLTLPTGVYEKEINIAPGLISEARILRQKKYAEMDRIKKTEAFMKVVKNHERDEEVLRDERKRVQRAVELFKTSRGWKNMAGSKELSRHLQTLKDVKNFNPQNPL